MGLTIHWELAFRGRKAELIEKLQVLKEKFSDLAVESVGEIIEIKRAVVEFGFGRYRGAEYDERSLGFMMTHAHFDETADEKKLYEIINRIGGTMNAGKLPPRKKQRYFNLIKMADELHQHRVERITKSGSGVVLRVNVGEGSESFSVMLGRLGKGRLWRGKGFTKTQYATHFTRCHMAVIQMLDLCEKAGILKSVRDEGEFWEKRDMEVLAKNINLSTETIRAITSAMKEPAEAAGFTVEAPVEKSANYMKVHKSKRSDSKKK
ncbi:MAG: hypothetical protein ABIH04_05475 [Planctomycetota bacterium]